MYWYAVVHMAVLTVTSASPGLEFQPKPSVSNDERTLIWYKANDEGDVNYWTNKIDSFLDTYQKGSDNRVNCDFDRPPEEGKVCNVDVNHLNPCISFNNYNYHKSAPCVFIKLNQVMNWKPLTYNSSDELPQTMPKYLKRVIKSQHRSKDMVWVSCIGVNPADIENMGPIQFIPTIGFPAYYFPFKNLDGYLSPLVAVHFKRPRTGIVINIECKAWVKNTSIKSVHFELLID